MTLVTRTAAQIAAADAADVSAVARRECSRRIYAVISLPTQMNLAHVKDTFTGADATMYAAGMGWVVDMRAAWPTMAAEGKDPLDDASWPAVPTGLVAWLEDY